MAASLVGLTKDGNSFDGCFTAYFDNVQPLSEIVHFDVKEHEKASDVYPVDSFRELQKPIGAHCDIMGNMGKRLMSTQLMVLVRDLKLKRSIFLLSQTYIVERTVSTVELLFTD